MRVRRTTGMLASICMSAIVALLVFGPAIAAAEIRFVTVPRTTEAKLQAMFTPLAEYLSREVGEKVTLVVPKTFKGVQETVEAGKAEIGFVNPLIYVQIKNDVNIEPLVLSSEVKSGTRIRGIIVVRKDSGIAKLRDLRGKKFMFVNQDSPAGHIFQKLLLSRAGFDINKDILMLPFANSHEGVIKAVLNGTVDAGGVREEQLDKMKGKIDTGKLKIVGYTDYFPNWPFFAAPTLNKATADRVRAALLKLRPNDPKNAKILSLARLTGFIAVTDREYEDMRAAAKLVGVL